MNISMEEKKVEAIARMKKLGIFPQTIKQFEDEGYISISEPPFGAFYWAEDEDLERIRQFEAEHNALVYVVIRSYTNIGKMDSMLFVSDYPEEWEMDRGDVAGDVANWQQVAYVYNHDAPDCSEMGAIGIAPTAAAGLCRTW